MISINSNILYDYVKIFYRVIEQFIINFIVFINHFLPKKKKKKVNDSLL